MDANRASISVAALALQSGWPPRNVINQEAECKWNEDHDIQKCMKGFLLPVVPVALAPAIKSPMTNFEENVNECSCNKKKQTHPDDYKLLVARI